MIKDKDFQNLKKLRYKYPADFDDFLVALKLLELKELPLKDFDDKNMVFCPNLCYVPSSVYKTFFSPAGKIFESGAFENEIVSTAKIESIDFSRDSVRRILKGYAPKDEEESRIYGLKKGFDFISDMANTINEENIYRLYMTMIGDFLEEDDKLKAGAYYRHDSVFVVSSRIEHIGMDCKKIPSAMKSLVDFINADDNINELFKAAIIHFYIAYIHPWFDGNGRMARMIHLWYLIRSGFSSALFVPFSSLISKSVNNYYKAFTLVEENEKTSGFTDITPFVAYCCNEIYVKSKKEDSVTLLNEKFTEMLSCGKITKKEETMWKFVISFYGNGEFSTKQLEKDFGDAAYATIRSFVIKFEENGLLKKTRYSNRVKYSVSD